MSGQVELKGPDFAKEGIAATDIAEGAMAAGRAEGEAVLVARTDGKLYAIGAVCSHYGGPLGEGLLVGDHVRCPWHHAQFCVRTGHAHAPALNPVACWEVEERSGRVYVTGKNDETRPRVKYASERVPESVVIVGAGAAGNAAAELLRDRGYAGPLAMIGAEESVPVDRPNLSKDYLAGTAPEEWIPLRSKEFYAEKKIALLLGVRVTKVDPKAKMVTLSDRRTVPFGALLLARRRRWSSPPAATPGDHPGAAPSGPELRGRSLAPRAARQDRVPAHAPAEVGAHASPFRDCAVEV